MSSSTLVTSGFGAFRTTTLTTARRASTTTTTESITTIPSCASSCIHDLRLVLNADGCTLPTPLTYPPLDVSQLRCQLLCLSYPFIFAASFCCIHSACPATPTSDPNSLDTLVDAYSAQEKWTILWLEQVCKYWAGVSIVALPSLRCTTADGGLPTVADITLSVASVGGKGVADPAWWTVSSWDIASVPATTTAAAGGPGTENWKDNAGRSLVVILGSTGLVLGALCVVAYYCGRWYQRVTKRNAGKKETDGEDKRAETEGLMEMGVQVPRKELDGRPVSELDGRESLTRNRGRRGIGGPEWRKRSPLSQVHMSPELEQAEPAEGSPLMKIPVSSSSDDQVVSPLIAGQDLTGSPLIGSDFSSPTQDSPMVRSDMSTHSGGQGEGSPLMGAEADARPKEQEPAPWTGIARNSIPRKPVGSPGSQHKNQGDPSLAGTGENVGLLENGKPSDNTTESPLDKNTRDIELIYGRDWVEV